MQIIIATHNLGKLEEFRLKLEKLYPSAEFLSLRDVNFNEDIDEFGHTFEQNALIKAQVISSEFPNHIVIADDSGLVCSGLGGEPGIYSARYAKEDPLFTTDKDVANMKRLITNLAHVSDRSAKFVTVLCIVKPGCAPVFAKGQVKGEILTTPIGTNGFGYDPIFSMDGLSTFAELTLEQKELVSHRNNAIDEMIKLNVLGATNV